MRKSGVFDDDRKNALTLLVNIDRSRIGDRWTLPNWMVENLEPLRPLGGDTSLEPRLVADPKVGRLEATALEFNIAWDHLVFVDAALTGVIRQGDLHHLQVPIAKLVGGKERAIGPAEGRPRYRRLRLQLRQKDELALVGLARVEDVLQEEGTNCRVGDARLVHDR